MGTCIERAIVTRDEVLNFISITVDYGYGSGSGSGAGVGLGFNSACGDGCGSGAGYGDSEGACYANSSEYKNSYYYGNSSSNDNGYSYGYCSSNGDGYGYGYSTGSGSRGGDGYGSGYGYINGNESNIKEINGNIVDYIDDIPTIITQVHDNFANGFIVKNNLTLSPCFIAKVGNSFAHGNTLEEAVADAEHKEKRRLILPGITYCELSI